VSGQPHPAAASRPIEWVDVGRKIDPRFLEPRHAGPSAEARIHALAWSAADGRLYVVIADAFVFWSDDDGRHWHEVPEVDRDQAGDPLERGLQQVDAIVDTLAGSVLLIGRDRRDGTERGIVWRKPRGAEAFARIVAAESAWATTKGGNAAAGYVGFPLREAVALSVYETPAHFWYSLDDGQSWRRQELAAQFALHVHEVYLPRAANAARAARLWVSGGDDPSGRGSGVLVFDSVGADGALGEPRWALREAPGYRLVGLAGDGKHVYVGNESLAGGMLRILDNAQSIERGDFEYVLGKQRHDYHQFRSMAVTRDGILAAATDSYAYVSDTIRADSGGFLYVSNDGGASFAEISLGMKWITALVHDGRAFWIAGGMNREYGGDTSDLRLSLCRVPKPGPWERLGGDYCAKAVIVDSSAFYAMAGFASHPHPLLEPGGRSFRADLSPYRSIVVEAEAYQPGRLVVEALPFSTWHPDEDAWRDVATLELDAPGRRALLLPPLASHHRWFRVRNAGPDPLPLRRVAFIGRR
jgi:hypothetical protein